MSSDRRRYARVSAGGGPTPAVMGWWMTFASSQAGASGFSFGPSDDALLLALLLPVVAGSIAGAVSGRKWPFGRSLLIGCSVVLLILLALFAQPGMAFFAAVAVPSLLGVYAGSHAAAHAATRWWVRKRRVKTLRA